MMLRRCRDRSSPLDTLNLYKNAGAYVKIKRCLFMVCHLYSYILMPITILLTFLIVYPKGLTGLLAGWCISYILITFFSSLDFLRSFEVLFQKYPIMKWNRWKRAMTGKSLSIHKLEHDIDVDSRRKTIDRKKSELLMLDD